MNTPPELIEATQRRVEEILKQAFPDYLSFSNGSYAISYGSTQVMVLVRPFTEDDCVVECMAHVVSGAKLTEELLQFLLRKNAELHFGGFGLLFDGTIIYSHSLPARSLQQRDLVAALTAVAVIADHYDDHIVAMAGGQRAIDLAAT